MGLTVVFFLIAIVRNNAMTANTMIAQIGSSGVDGVVSLGFEDIVWGGGGVGSVGIEVLYGFSSGYRSTRSLFVAVTYAVSPMPEWSISDTEYR